MPFLVAFLLIAMNSGEKIEIKGIIRVYIIKWYPYLKRVSILPDGILPDIQI